MLLMHGVPQHMFYIFVADRDKGPSARRDQRKRIRNTVLYWTDNLDVAEVFRLHTPDMHRMGDQLRANLVYRLGNFLFLGGNHPVFVSCC